MDIITDEYSRELGRRNLAKYNARVKHMSYHFTPESLASFTVNTNDLFQIAPPRNQLEHMQRLETERARAENNTQAAQFVNNQISIEITGLREQLKDPRVDAAEAETIYKQLVKLMQSQINPNDPQLVVKQEIIHKTVENEQRDRSNIIRNYGTGLKDLHDQMEASNANQIQAVRKFGSVERAIDSLSNTILERTTQQLAGEGKGREVDRGEEEEEEEEEEEIEVVEPESGEREINKIFADADNHVGHKLSTKKDMVKWVKFVKSKNPSLIVLPEGYDMSELNKLLGNRKSSIKIDDLPVIIASIRGQV